MTKITVHHWTKDSKPISVNGEAFGRARKVDGVWKIYRGYFAMVTGDGRADLIAESKTFRGIELAVAAWLRGQSK